MSTQVGIWIDHRKAVIVFLLEKDVEIKIIESKLERHVRPSGGWRSKTPYGPQDIMAEDIRDRKYEGHLGKYYDRVLNQIRNADSLLILGPNAAKNELEKHIKNKEPRNHAIHLITTDKMTDRQIVVRVRQYFEHGAQEQKGSGGTRKKYHDQRITHHPVRGEQSGRR
jgi:stalled ribosome rescue protein Dom34